MKSDVATAFDNVSCKTGGKENKKPKATSASWRFMTTQISSIMREGFYKICPYTLNP